MENTNHPSDPPPQGEESGNAGISPARIAGVLLILTAVATVVSVISRVSASSDQATLAASLMAIAENRGVYGAGGAARLVSAITLMAGAWYLSRTWVIREGWGNPLVPLLFAVSAVFTAVSGISAVALAVMAPTVTDPALITPDAAAETVNLLRWLPGKIGFALAGLALLVAARQQWKGGGKLRRLAPVSAIIGLAMQFIWIDSATFMHPINGTAFVLWLLLIGSMLAGGFVERHFRAMRKTAEQGSQ